MINLWTTLFSIPETPQTSKVPLKTFTVNTVFANFHSEVPQINLFNFSPRINFLLCSSNLWPSFQTSVPNEITGLNRFLIDNWLGSNRTIKPQVFKRDRNSSLNFTWNENREYTSIYRFFITEILFLMKFYSAVLGRFLKMFEF